jgi:hypothetical protein
MDPEAKKVMENLANVRLAHEAMMLNDAKSTLKTNRAVVKSHHKEAMGDAFVEDDADDTIHIGDSHIYQNATPPQQAQVSSPIVKGLSPLVLGLIIGGTGLGGTIAGAAINYLLSPDVTANKTININTPGLGFYEPDDK